MKPFGLLLRNTAEQFKGQVECLKAAGIWEHAFLAFGSLLGYVKIGTILANDDDVDIGIHSAGITQEQEDEYIRLIKVAGLNKYRYLRGTNPANGRLFWASIKSVPDEDGFKCCHWFMWNRGGFTWHHKGPGTLVKGIPEQALELGPDVEFLGARIRVPKRIGACLDWWYPDWATPRSVNSAPRAIMSIGNYSDESTWAINTSEESV